MSAIKRFFEKRKLNMKFKKAGEGHKLDEPSHRQQPHRGDGAVGGARPPTRAQLANPEAALRAAEAALARQNLTKDNIVVKPRMRTEMEKERRRMEEEERARQAAVGGSSPREVMLDGAPMMPEVMYCCPEIGEEGEKPRPKEEMEALIHAFLYSSLGEDPEMTSAVMIHTLNKQPDKVKACVETLVKLLDNIINHPGEDKYRKIRAGNKMFQEKVSSMQGTEEFMQAARFMLRNLPVEDHEEPHWVMEAEEAQDTQRLSDLKEVLLGAEAIRPHLHRSMRVFHPSSQAAHFDIPESFYTVSPAELKREQQARTEAVEKLGMLRTKAMRERDEQRELRKYRFTLIRVRFPDGLLLQGVFKANDKLPAVREFVGEQLASWLPFVLKTARGQKLTREDDDSTLAALGLAPAALLTFEWEPEVLQDIVAQKGSHQQGPYLKPEAMAQIHSL